MTAQPPDAGDWVEDVVAHGASRAFARLYSEHLDALYRECHAITRHPEDASDCVQAAMLRAYRAVRAGQRPVAVRAWLMRIARNEAFDLLRRRRVQRELVFDAPAPPADVVERVVEQETVELMFRDLSDLPDRQRTALVMREMQGFSYPDVASRLGISGDAARQSVHEARMMLNDYAAGRELGCEAVRDLLREGDGRTAHNRRIAAHLRSCDDCRRARFERSTLTHRSSVR